MCGRAAVSVTGVCPGPQPEAPKVDQCRRHESVFGGDAPPARTDHLPPGCLTPRRQARGERSAELLEVEGGRGGG